LTCESTRSFSSGLEQTMENVPARSPYKPRFWSVSAPSHANPAAQEQLPVASRC
jgi:hypothetical protein